MNSLGSEDGKTLARTKPTSKALARTNPTDKTRGEQKSLVKH